MLTRAWWTKLIPALLCALIFCGANSKFASAADDITPQRALEKFAESVERIESYDVMLTETRTPLLKQFIEQRDGKSYAVYEPFPDGESPKITKSKSRQITKGNESFRIEEFDADDEEPRRITAITGDRMRWIEPLANGRKVGFLDQRSDPTILSLMRDGRHYGTFYANAWNSIPWLNVLGERKNLKNITSEKSPALYVIESAAEPDTPTLSGSNVRIALDPQNGYLPAWIEEYIPGSDRVFWRLEILDRKTLLAGIAAPTKIKYTRYDLGKNSSYLGQPVVVCDYEVDLEKSRWNCELDESLFTLEFPAGMTVFDQIKARALQGLTPKAARRQRPEPKEQPK